MDRTSIDGQAITFSTDRNGNICSVCLGVSVTVRASGVLADIHIEQVREIRAAVLEEAQQKLHLLGWFAVVHLQLVRRERLFVALDVEVVVRAPARTRAQDW